MSMGLGTRNIRFLNLVLCDFLGLGNYGLIFQGIGHLTSWARGMKKGGCCQQLCNCNCVHSVNQEFPLPLCPGCLSESLCC